MADPVGGAALGAVFGELLSAVLKMKDKAIMFRQTLTDLRSTLETIAPVIKEIEQQNSDLGRPKEELIRLIREMEEGTKLVCKCSKIHRLNYFARVRYHDQLMALLTSLVRFILVEMQTQTARDQKETLLKVTRILSKVNKLPSFSSNTTSSDCDPVLVHVDVSESETHDSIEMRPDENAMGTESIEQVMEHITQVTRSSSSDSDPVPFDVSESEIVDSTATQTVDNATGLRTNSAEQVTLTQQVSQSEAKTDNNQATEHLMSGKSYDQLYTDEKRFLGIRLPKIKPILPKIGVFNRQAKKVTFEPLPAFCTACGTRIKQSDTLNPGGADKTSNSYCNQCYNQRGCRERLVFLDCSYRFDIDDLLRASAEVLGRGSYGTTYKATLEDGRTVAVKRLREVKVWKEEFGKQVEIVQRLLSEHPNVIPLRAYYYSRDEKLLIYDYITSGSFSRLLHGGRESPPDWDSRLKISLGAARGIAHIHSVSEREFVHGNIKSSNVLLTEDLQGCISDFGLTPLLSDLSVNPSGNEGYQAPEVFETGRLTRNSDVYSFGVLLLEMLSGKSPIQCSWRDDVVDLPKWVQSIAWTVEVFDIELLRYPNREEEMVKLLQLAMTCVATVPDSRPSMEEVVRTMEEIIASNEF